MAEQFKALYPKKYYTDYLSQNIRPDGRNLLNFRPAVINTDSINTADGSAIVKLGNTTVICGVKAELAKPKPIDPERGYLIPNVELPPLCSSQFKPGPPSELAQVTSQHVYSVFRDCACLDLKQLCIAPDKLVWVLYCDLVCLDHDGALVDACVIALGAALKTVTLPQVKYNEKTETIKVLNEERKPLVVTELPASSTFAIFDEETLIADPTADEENLCQGIITVVVKGDLLCSVHKPGGSPVTETHLETCIKETKKQAKLLCGLLKTALNN